MIIKGKTIKYGDDVNTDVIIPGKYLILSKPKDLASHAMEGLDSDFFKKFNRGDIIVAGKNFGCGSSREQAAICLKYAGVGAVIAKSFARIFFRNAINQGLSIIESINAVDNIKNFDELEINIYDSSVINKTKNTVIKFEPLPEFIQDIINDGGLVNNLIKKFKQ